MKENEATGAMSQLTEKQQKFVIALLETGGQNNAEAARIAGYSQTNINGCAIEANRLLRKPKVIAAIKEEAERRIHGGVLLGASVLVEIAGDKLHKDRFRAASALLDRGGMMIVGKTEHSLVIEDKRTEAELIEFITAQARLAGLDPRTLLGFNPPTIIDVDNNNNNEDIIDVDYEEYVEPEL
jgi:phage terminase small subunit